MTDVDPLDEGVPRNGRGAPLIIPCKRGKPDMKAKLVAYMRASTLCKALDGASNGLTKWKLRHAVVGVAIRPYLSAQIAALGPNVNAYEPEDKRNLDALIEQAHDASGGNDKANYGTVVHTLTEPDRDPLAFDEADDELRKSIARDAAAYAQLVEELGLVVVATEVFVVNDELLVAGTFDHAYRLTRDLVLKLDGKPVTIPADTVLLGDKKTGTLHIGAHAIQLATYARAKRYDHVTGERTALDVSPQWGLAVHIPRGEGKAVAVVVDLHLGYAAAKLAKAAHDYGLAANVRKLGTVVGEAVVESVTVPDDAVNLDGQHSRTVEVVADPTPEPGVVERERAAAPPTTFGEAFSNLTDAGALNMQQPDAILAAIAKAPDGDALAAVWRRYRAEWNEDYTLAAKARTVALDRGKK